MKEARREVLTRHQLERMPLDDILKELGRRKVNLPPFTGERSIGTVIERILMAQTMERRELAHTIDCPNCGEDVCVHIEHVGVYRQDTVVYIRGDEEIVVKPKWRSGQGSSVVITFFCENGHRWESVFHFHGGSVYHEEVVLEDWRVDESVDEPWPEELWRT